ncbi:uncharacterized protein [Leuresthes tenuis]|uniref:uncharacterized protein n=1 Tax=Leuresthes tenuis TaxID=355514 RepID=UPI003B5031F6
MVVPVVSAVVDQRCSTSQLVDTDVALPSTTRVKFTQIQTRKNKPPHQPSLHVGQSNEPVRQVIVCAHFPFQFLPEQDASSRRKSCGKSFAQTWRAVRSLSFFPTFVPRTSAPTRPPRSSAAERRRQRDRKAELPAPPATLSSDHVFTDACNPQVSVNAGTPPPITPVPEAPPTGSSDETTANQTTQRNLSTCLSPQRLDCSRSSPCQVIATSNTPDNLRKKLIFFLVFFAATKPQSSRPGLRFPADLGSVSRPTWAPFPGRPGLRFPGDLGSVSQPTWAPFPGRPGLRFPGDLGSVSRPTWAPFPGRPGLRFPGDLGSVSRPTWAPFPGRPGLRFPADLGSVSRPTWAPFPGRPGLRFPADLGSVSRPTWAPFPGRPGLRFPADLGSVSRPTWAPFPSRPAAVCLEKDQLHIKSVVGPLDVPQNATSLPPPWLFPSFASLPAGDRSSGFSKALKVEQRVCVRAVVPGQTDL